MTTNTNAPAAHDLCADPRCGAPLSEHIGGKSCVVGTKLTRQDGKPLRWYDLPMAADAWSAAGRNVAQ